MMKTMGCKDFVVPLFFRRGLKWIAHRAQWGLALASWAWKGIADCFVIRASSTIVPRCTDGGIPPQGPAHLSADLVAMDAELPDF